MKTAPGVSIGLALAGLIAAPLSAATDIGSRRALFVDDALIEKISG